MKKIFFMFAALCACTLSIFAHDFEVDGIYYNFLGGDSVEVTYYGDDYKSATYSGELSLQSTVTYDDVTYLVTAIGDYAFYCCQGLTGSLTIPTGVTTIGKAAFYICSNLTGVLQLPEGLITIEDYAFVSCGFGSTFNTSLTLPHSVTTIGKYAFHECQLFTGTLTIPSNVTTIGSAAFGGCCNLSFIEVAEDNEFYYAKGNCLIEKVSKTLLTGCKNSIIPDDGSIDIIDDYAFYFWWTFKGSLNIPQGVKTIGEMAFGLCEGITSLVLPDGIETIEAYAFWGCTGLTCQLIIPESVKTIGDWAFSCCWNFTGDLMIPASVTKIGTNAFNHLRKIETIDVAEDNEFYCAKNNCLIEKSTKTLLMGRNNSVIPNDGSINIIAYSAFGGCSGLTNISIPKEVTTIGEYAFDGCSGLIGSLTIPENVTTIGDGAFRDCSNISTFHIEAASPPTLGIVCFDGISSDAIVTVSCDAVEDYKSTEGWKDYKNHIVGTFNYTLTVNTTSEAQGVVTITQVPSCENNGVAIIKAMPTDGYKFYKWNDGSTENPRNIEIAQDTTFIAEFIPAITDLQFKQTSLILEVGDSYYLNTIVEPKHADKSTLVWSSNNSDIVSVDGCIATAQQVGEATITVTTADNTLSATCEIIIVEEGQNAEDDVVVDPDTESVDINWTPVDGAAYYVFVVYADDSQVTKICTLTFNAWGHLTNIHFQPKKPASTPEDNPFNFTVTGLEENTTYGYSMSSYDEEETLISNIVGEFTTTSNITTAVETPLWGVSDEIGKILENGTLYILRGGEKYTIDGRRVM